jgi:hypothetical protein
MMFLWFIRQPFNDPAVLSSVTPTGEKLVHSPPIGPEDDLLAGYCSQPAPLNHSIRAAAARFIDALAG